MTATAEQLAKAAALRADAAQCTQRSSDSWDRSDTDGFLSQWANDSMAQLYRYQAELLENGERAEFDALFDLDGNLIEDARWVETRYGWTWVHNTQTGPKWFRPSRAEKDSLRRKNDAKKGYYVGTISAPAWAKHDSRDRSFNVFIRTYRTTKGMDGVEVVDNGK